MFEEDFYIFFENTASVRKDFEAGAQCTDELLNDGTDMASRGFMAINPNSDHLHNNDMIYGGMPQWSPTYDRYDNGDIIDNPNVAQAEWTDFLPFPYPNNPATTIPRSAYTNSDIAGAPHVPFFPEHNSHHYPNLIDPQPLSTPVYSTPTYSSSRSEFTRTPASSTVAPHLGGYHGLLAGVGRFDLSPQHTTVANNSAQSQAYPQPPSLTHVVATRQFPGTNMRNEEFSYVDPRMFIDHSLTVNMSPPTTSYQYPTPASPSSPLMPELTDASWDSTAFASPTMPTFSSTPPIIPVAPASPPMREAQPVPAPAWALKELRPFTSQQSTSTWTKERTRKRTLDDTGINEDARAGQSGAANRPQTRKRLKTSTTEARAPLAIGPSIGISSTTAIETLTRQTVNYEVSGQGDRIPRTVAPEALPALDAGPSKHPRSKISPAGKREPVVVTDEILRERKKTNKQIQDDRTKRVKISGKWMAICCWDGCTNDPFTRPSDAVRHIRRIHLDQRWVCSERDCGKALSRKDSLRRHVNTVHKDLRAVETKDGEKVNKGDQPAGMAEDAEADGEGGVGRGEGSGRAT